MGKRGCRIVVVVPNLLIVLSLVLLENYIQVGAPSEFALAFYHHRRRAWS